MIKYTVFDAFTGISPFEKLGVVKFLEANMSCSRSKIQQAVDYAVKDCPSFGGFILTATLENEPVATAVVNKPGTQCFHSKNLLVYFAIADKVNSGEFSRQFFDKIVQKTKGDISLHLDPESQDLTFLKEIGFRPNTLEMKFSPLAVSKAV